MGKAQEILDMAVETAEVIGYELSRQDPPPSDDPFMGYAPSDLIEMIGEDDIKRIRELHEKEQEEGLKGLELEIGSCVVPTRGKLKGLLGWVNATMPSQYNENELAYLVVSLKGEQGWVNGKSLKLRAPQVGERDLLAKLKAEGEAVRKWDRGSSVQDAEGRTGVLVGKGADDRPIPSVAVHWNGATQEEWVLAGALSKLS